MRERRRFKDQYYEKIKSNCLKEKQLFVDTAFPPTNASLFLETGRSSDIVWKRPAELHPDPKLFVEGASANDVTQGILGNCWFVSACSALTHNQELLDRVIPDAEDQEWGKRHPYAGVFRFRFWRFGQWVEVVIDDLLPTRNGKLLFARSKTPNEFWSALLEKAFAKLYGCYENLVGGHLSDALQDVSGGVSQSINVAKFQKNHPQRWSEKLYANMKESFDNKALVVAAIAAKNKEEVEESLECGLVKGHAYAVVDIRHIELDNIGGGGFGQMIFGAGQSEQRALIRLQNPWGEKEWNGPWSDSSTEWQKVTPAQQANLGLQIEDDGEFWMPWESFIEYFTDISVCRLFNTSIFSLSKRYHEKIFLDGWSTNGAKSGAPQDMAGGCLNFSATFCNNPQYSFDVHDPQEEIMFALTQREPNEESKHRDPYVTIGMHAMKVENNRVHRIHQSMTAVGTSDYANARSAFLHLKELEVGRYILLPTTFAPKEETTFMLRVYSDHDLKMRKLLKHAPAVGFCGCKTAENVTRITINSAVLNGQHEMDVYCLLHSSKSTVRTTTKKSTVRPIFNEQFVFHRGSARQPYKLQVFEDRAFAKDKLLGEAEVTALIDNDTRELELDIVDKSGKTTGKIRVSVSAFDDPMYL